MKAGITAKKAAEYVQRNGLPASGYVIVFRRKIVGWVPDMTTPPNRFRPGVLAVAVNDIETFYRASGGHVITGATHWVLCRTSSPLHPNETSN